MVAIGFWEMARRRERRRLAWEAGALVRGSQINRQATIHIDTTKILGLFLMNIERINIHQKWWYSIYPNLGNVLL
jgi:hypothetical protein